MEERDRLPAIWRGIPLLAHLQRKHHIQVRQPRFAAAFARQSNVRRRSHALPDVLRHRPESLNPISSSTAWMVMCRIITGQARARLVHINAVHSQFLHGLLRETRVSIAPERRAHAHGGARLPGKGVVNLRMNSVISPFYRPAFRVLIGPTFSCDPPEPLIHVNQRSNIMRMRVRHRADERSCSLAWRQILWKSRVIRTAMPPMPKHTHWQIEPRLQRKRRVEHLG
ncbi:hypothetical protein SDC9_166353 [bioreactor metagenome]|uniref:Uncharacterized protein n=1 Tax=bioreactor metagenome TaxID=1076179 RepID=A0A645FWV4_9ZZZZ